MLIKAEDGGPVFFRQERVGLGGRRFRIWKFRSMVTDAEGLGTQLTTARDTRITRVGAWLRRRKLDELPQLLNVLAGEMSIVGPRPEVPKYVDLYTEDQRRVLALKPGITDVASIAFADESALLGCVPEPEGYYLQCIVPAKIRLNLQYAEHASPLRDLSVIIDTITHVVPRRRTALTLPSIDQ